MFMTFYNFNNSQSDIFVLNNEFYEIRDKIKFVSMVLKTAVKLLF